MTGFSAYPAFTKAKAPLPPPNSNPSGFQVVREGDWLLVGLGAGKLGELNKTIAAVKKDGRPAPATTNWVEILADLPKLGATFPLLMPLGNLPKVDGVVVGKGETLRTLA